MIYSRVTSLPTNSFQLHLTATFHVLTSQLVYFVSYVSRKQQENSTLFITIYLWEWGGGGRTRCLVFRRVKQPLKKHILQSKPSIHFTHASHVIPSSVKTVSKWARGGVTGRGWSRTPNSYTHHPFTPVEKKIIPTKLFINDILFWPQTHNISSFFFQKSRFVLLETYVWSCFCNHTVAQDRVLDAARRKSHARSSARCKQKIR